MGKRKTPVSREGVIGDRIPEDTRRESDPDGKGEGTKEGVSSLGRVGKLHTSPSTLQIFFTKITM